MFETIFVLFSQRVERVMIKILVALLILLLVAQIAMQYEPIRHRLSRTDRLEGEIYHMEPPIEMTNMSLMNAG